MAGSLAWGRSGDGRLEGALYDSGGLLTERVSSAESGLTAMGFVKVRVVWVKG